MLVVLTFESKTLNLALHHLILLLPVGNRRTLIDSMPINKLGSILLVSAAAEIVQQEQCASVIHHDCQGLQDQEVVYSTLQ